MSRLRFTTMLALFLFAASSAVFAQATRTWVSGVGDDANPCSRTAPCKTFPGAISKTAPGGEIDVLDPGGFGAVTITKSISLEAVGTVAGVLVSGTNGIVVSAGPSDNVVIRGLTIEGLGTGLNGIRFISGGSLTVENCTINGFTQNAISMEGAGQLFVHDTTIRHNGSSGASFGGISVIPASGAVGGVIDHVRLEGNGGFGVKVGNGANLSVSNSIAINHLAGGGPAGFPAGFAVTSVSNSGSLSLTGCTASNNGGSGVLLNGGLIRVTEMSVTGNSVGFNNMSGGTFNSFGTGTNWVDGNGTNVVGTVTKVPLQ